MSEATADDQAFIEGFERCTLAAADFGHPQHIRLTWLYLREQALEAALERVRTGLVRFATANGAAQRYHETITWAYVLLINERMERGGRSASWAEFAAANADLFARDCLLRYYRAATLASDLARRVFVLPDNLDADQRSV